MTAAAAHYIDRDAAVAELWRRGELSWKLRSEQKRLKSELERPHIQLGVFNISRRLGKTYTLVDFCVEQAMRSKQKIRYGTAFLTDLEEFVLPAFQLILDDCPEHLRPVYKATKKVWVFPNGSEIKLVGLDRNPNGLRGNAINIIVIDEAAFVSNLRFIYTSVIVPATAKQQNIKVVFISTPPESPDHYFVELIAKAQTQENGYYACLTIDDISDLDPRERQRLLDEVGGEHSTTAQREFFCKLIVDSTRALCPEFDRARHVRPIELPPYYFCWVGGDIGGVTSRSVAHLCAYDFERGKVLFLAESAHSNQTPTSDIVAGFKGLEGDPRASAAVRRVDASGQLAAFRRRIDAPGQTLTDLRVKHEYLASLPDKSSGDFDAKVNSLRVAFIQDKIEIDPSCKLLILTLETGMLNKQRTDFHYSEALGDCDAFDSAAYAYRHAIKENPFPANLGLHRQTHHIANQTEQQLRHQQALTKAFASSL